MSNQMRVALACVRIVAGAAFFVLGCVKLNDPAFLYGGLLHELSDFGAPFPFYQKLLTRFVEHNQTLFAYLVGASGVLLGLSLLLGLLVSWSSLAGGFLLLNFACATSAGNPARLAGLLALAVALILLGRLGAGLKWGLDGWLIRHIKDWLVLFPLRLTAPQED
jgi:uncharacterized membrane protein YphA (DoxX/SURF4 family)